MKRRRYGEAHIDAPDGTDRWITVCNGRVPYGE